MNKDIQKFAAAFATVFAAAIVFTVALVWTGEASAMANRGDVSQIQNAASTYTQANVTYDLTHVYDKNLRSEIIAALDLGYAAKGRGGKNIAREIANLQGAGPAKVIRFYSNEQEQNPNAAASGAPATAIWTGPHGEGDFSSPPSTRTDLRIYVSAQQPYWYMVNSIWHELLHTTLSITHHQTTPEGTMPASYVNDGVWYTTIRQIMLDFPTTAKNPVTGATEELYNVENSPWS